LCWKASFRDVKIGLLGGEKCACVLDN